MKKYRIINNMTHDGLTEVMLEVYDNDSDMTQIINLGKVTAALCHLFILNGYTKEIADATWDFVIDQSTCEAILDHLKFAESEQNDILGKTNNKIINNKNNNKDFWDVIFND